MGPKSDRKMLTNMKADLEGAAKLLTAAGLLVLGQLYAFGQWLAAPDFTTCWAVRFMVLSRLETLRLKKSTGFRCANR